MSLYSALDATKHFDEFDFPLASGSGFVSPATRRSRARANLDVPSASEIAASIKANNLRFSSLPAAITTAGVVTYTAAQVLGGVISRDPNGANRADVFPTAALLVAAISGVQVGTTFDLIVNNTADAAETITITPGSGGTPEPTTLTAFGQDKLRIFTFVITSITPAAEAYVVYEHIIA